MSERDKKIQKARDEAVKRYVDAGMPADKARDRANDLANRVDQQRKKVGK